MIKTNKNLKIRNPLDHPEAKRLKHCIEAVLKGHVFGALIISKGGLGKTRNIREIIEKHRLKENEEWIHVAANISDTELYKILYDHRDKIIFFDDIGMAAKTNAGITILKQATETKDGNNRIISWVSPTYILKEYPHSFEFEGRLIMCLNIKPNDNNEDIAALKSRFLSCYLEPSNKTVLEMIYSIRQKLSEDLVSTEDFEEIFDYVCEESDENSELNIRVFKNAIVWHRMTKNWQKHVLEDLGFDDDTRYVIDISSNKGLRGKAATQEWVHLTGKRKSAYYSILRQLKSKFII